MYLNLFLKFLVIKKRKKYNEIFYFIIWMDFLDLWVNFMLKIKVKVYD